MSRLWIVLGALAGLTGVAFAAMGAHVLAARLPPEGLEVMRTATLMQLLHAPVLLFCGVWSERAAPPRRGFLHAAGLCFAIGLVAFSGALHARVLVDLRMPGIAPIGGALLMLGWILIILAALRRP